MSLCIGELLFGFGLRYSRHDYKGPDPTSCRYESSSWRIRSSGAGLVVETKLGGPEACGQYLWHF
jgi:hypothetical protein